MPKSEPQAERQPPATQSANQAKWGRWDLDVPLDLLCEMTWRIGKFDRGVEIDTRKWLECASLAYGLIRLAYLAKMGGLAREDYLQNPPPRPLLAKLKPKESEKAHVSFNRGCVLLNTAKDPKLRLSIAKFRHAYDHGLVTTSKSMQKFMDEGFSLQELEDFYEQLEATPDFLKRAVYGSKVKKAKKVH
jgi:hypothetical protein